MTPIPYMTPQALSRAIGAEIKRIRRTAKLSQTACGKVCGVDQSAWSRIESGKQQMTLLQFMAFCSLVGEPIASFTAVWRATIL